MTRVRSFLAASLIVVGVLTLGAGAALAATPASTGFLTYHDSVYGYSISYPRTWKLVNTPLHMPVFLSPGTQSACQVNIAVQQEQGTAQAALAAAVPRDAVIDSRGSVDGAPSVTFHQDVGPRPGTTGSIDATTNNVVVAQPKATHGVNLYTLSLIIYRTSPLTSTSTSAACRKSFHAMVGSFMLPHTASGGIAAPAPNALTDPVNPAVQYAENAWNWWYYTGSCCAPDGAGQPAFQCAEFVARSLSAQGQMPNLNTNSPQTENGATSPYNFDYYRYSYNGNVYRLLDTGTSTITGLYQYLINNGLGMNVGDDPAGAVPGDVVFYYDNGGTVPANLEHTAILVATGTTPGGSDTLIDEHNDAGYHWGYASIGWWDNNNVFHPYSRTIVHLNMNEAFAPAIGSDISGRTTVFARGSGSHIYALTQSASGAWPSSWVSLGGIATSDPVFGWDISNRRAVFVRSGDNAIWTTVQRADGTWPGDPWTKLGGVATSDPVPGWDISNRPAVFIRGTDNKIWTTVQNNDGTWPPYPAVNWTPLGAIATSDPAFGWDISGRPAVFVRSGDGAIWVTVQNSNATWPGDPWLRLGIG